jgi:hypothetical protein
LIYGSHRYFSCINRKTVWYWWSCCPSPFTATGGTITYSGGKTIHTFTSSGTFSFDASGLPGTVEYLVVAGGGGGGYSMVVVEVLV